SWRTASSPFGFLRGAAELISDAANGLDQRPSIALEFLTQMADVHVHGAIEWRRLAVVERFHQRIAREHSSGPAHELLEDVELERGEFDAAPVAPHFARTRIERDAIDVDAA